MPFEPLIRGNASLLDGTIAVQVVDFAEPQSPQTIIETNDPWQIKVNWSLTGLVAPAFGGFWHVAAYLEDLEGGTDPGKVASVDVDLNSAPPSFNRQYEAKMTVSAGKVHEGIYKLNVAITYTNLGIKLEMAAFSEGSILQFYDPGPLD